LKAKKEERSDKRGIGMHKCKKQKETQCNAEDKGKEDKKGKRKSAMQGAQHSLVLQE